MTITLKQIIKALGIGEIVILEGEEALEAVKEDGFALRYVHNQTPEICLEAVKKYGFALQYVHNQTPEICLAAVKRDGHTLQYVHNRTPEICLAAVRQEGKALQYVDPSVFEEEKTVTVKLTEYQLKKLFEILN